MFGRLIPAVLAVCLSGCLEAVEDPRPPPSSPDRDGSTFDPGRKPVTGSGYGSGSGSGSGSGGTDLPDAGLADADSAADSAADAAADSAADAATDSAADAQ